MCGDHSLEYWVVDEFSRHGRHEDGTPIGKKALKATLVQIGRPGTEPLKIREVVNSLTADEIIPSDSWQGSLAKLVHKHALVHAFDSSGNQLRRKVIAKDLCDLAPASLHDEIRLALASIDTVALCKKFHENQRAPNDTSPPSVSSSSSFTESEESPNGYQTASESHAPTESSSFPARPSPEKSEMSASELEDFVCQQIPILGFDSRGQWVGFERVKQQLCEMKPGYRHKIEALVERIKFVFENAEAQRSEMSEPGLRAASQSASHTERTGAPPAMPSSSTDKTNDKKSARSNSFGGILDESVEAWIERQFYLGGLNENGEFVGMVRFETFLGQKLQGKNNKSRRARVFALVREMYRNRSFPLASWNNSAAQSVIDEDKSIPRGGPTKAAKPVIEIRYDFGNTHAHVPASSVASGSGISNRSHTVSLPGESPIMCPSKYPPDRSFPGTPHDQYTSVRPVAASSTPPPASYSQLRIRNFGSMPSTKGGLSNSWPLSFGGPEPTRDRPEGDPGTINSESRMAGLDDVSQRQSEDLSGFLGIARSNGKGEGKEKQQISTALPARNDQSWLLDFRGQRSNKADVERAVMFSAQLFDMDDQAPALIPQYGLLGNGYPVVYDLAVDPMELEDVDRRVFLNTNHPASFFICGLQGSGKSHTTSCLLENFLLDTPTLGSLEYQCSAMVLHYDQFTSRETFRPCEAAFLAQRGQQFPGQPAVETVNVLVSASNFYSLQRAYANIPGVNVRKLKLKQKDLTISSLLTLMSFDPKQQPLYMGQVTKVLRKMAEASDSPFDYLEFKARLHKESLMPDQRRPLDQRLDLVESFLDLGDQEQPFDFGSGTLTIVDLSCPFLDESNACMLFNICIGLYLEDKSSDKGKIIAVDEAHKCMSNTQASKVLTEQLLSVIRQQRHYGTRVIISTQEPTIFPRLMDLLSATIIHRFSSPEWFNMLKHHLTVLSEADDGGRKLFDQIIDLPVGQALVFASSAMISYEAGQMPQKLSSKAMRLAVRKRLTWDGGRSVMCV